MKKRVAVCICCIAMLCTLFRVQSPVMAQDVSGEGNMQREAGSEESAETVSTDRFLSNGLFSVTMPEDVQGLYEGIIEENKIVICDKKSREEKAGGQVFEISAEKTPMEYTRNPSLKKYGELTSGDGTVYDMTLSRPTDVRYTPVNGGKPESYSRLQEKAQQIMDSIASTDGGSYSAGAGMKGEDLYQDVLKKYVTAVTERWNAARLEEEEMSPAYELIGKVYGEAALDHIYYAYTDLTGEGVEELLIGEIRGEDRKLAVYDIYTIDDHKPFHSLSGWNENWYYAGELYLINVYKGVNDEEYWSVQDEDYTITNSKEKGFSNGFDTFVIDRSKNEAQPWFISGYNGSWQNVTQEEYEEKFNRSVKLKELESRPLSELSAGQ